MHTFLALNATILTRHNLPVACLPSAQLLHPLLPNTPYCTKVIIKQWLQRWATHMYVIRTEPHRSIQKIFTEKLDTTRILQNNEKWGKYILWRYVLYRHCIHCSIIQNIFYNRQWCVAMLLTESTPLIWEWSVLLKYSYIGVNLAIYESGTEVLKSGTLAQKSRPNSFSACYTCNTLSHFILYISQKSTILYTCGGKMWFYISYILVVSPLK